MPTLKDIGAEKIYKLEDIGASKKNKSFIEKAGDFFGVTNLAKGIGTAIAANLPSTIKYQQEYQERQDDLNKIIREQYANATKEGNIEKQNRLRKLLVDNGESINIIEASLKEAPTTQQIVGSGLQTAGTLFGTNIVGKGLLKNALINSAEGAIAGALASSGMNLQQSKNRENLLKDTLLGATAGGLLGAAIPLAIGGIGKVAGAASKKAANIIDSARGIKNNKTQQELIAFSNDKIKSTILDELDNVLQEEIDNPKIDNSSKIIGLKKELKDVDDIFTNPLDDTNELIKQAKRIGYDEGDLNLIARGSDNEQLLKKEILANSELQRKNPSSIRIAETVPARKTLEVYDFLKNKKEEVGKIISNNLEVMDQRLYPFDDVYDNFINELNKSGVMENNGKLDFSKSIIKDDTSGQKLLNSLYDDFIDNGGQFTPAEVDTIRRRIASQLDLFKKKLDLSDEADRILYNTRKELMSGLEDIDDSYRQNNRNYAMLSDAIDSFEKKFIGKDLDAFSKDSSVQEKVAQVARRMQGNASAVYNDIFSNLENTAEYFGLQSDVNIRRLFDFADFINRENKTLKKTSLPGQQQIAADAAQDTIDVLYSRFGRLRVLKKMIDKLGGDISEKKKKAILDILDNYRQSEKKINIPQASTKILEGERKAIMPDTGSRSFEQDVKQYQEDIKSGKFKEEIQDKTKIGD